MQTSEQEYFASQSARSLSPLENEEKRACLYSVRPLESVNAGGVGPGAYVIITSMGEHGPAGAHGVVERYAGLRPELPGMEDGELHMQRI